MRHGDTAGLMPTKPAAPPANAAPSTALAAALRRWRGRLPRTLGLLALICLSISLLLWTIDGGRFSIKITYALLIGLSCTLINDSSWMAQAWLHDRLRALRRLPRAPGGFERGWTGVLPSAALCLLLGPLMGQALADAVFGFSSPSLLNLSSANTRITMFVSLLATLTLVVVLNTVERLSAARAQVEAAQRQAAENQLRMLQSQLEPHMLFNTLANLRVLITLDPPRAQAMLDRLIGFLRATLSVSRQDQHPLAAEFRHTEDYLALMAMRMGPRLVVKLHLPEDLGTLPLPPLLLQPLVENAIKHGLEPKVEGGRIEVTAQREGQRLRLQVRDTGVGLGATSNAASTAGSTGFGLEQVRTRLATLYGERAALTLDPAVDAEGGALVTLTLPLD